MTQALVLSNDILNLAPSTLLISYMHSDIVTQEGREPGYFYSKSISPGSFYVPELELVLLRVKGPENVVGKGNLEQLGPRAYFVGKWTATSKPVCRSEDGIVPIQTHEGEPQLKPMSKTTCQDCAFGNWTKSEETGRNVPPACGQKVRLWLAHLNSGIRFIHDIRAGTKSFFRFQEMYRSLTKTITFESSLSGQTKPLFSHSFTMGIKQVEGKAMLTFTKLKPVQGWERFIPLYQEWVPPPKMMVTETSSELIKRGCNG